MSFDPIETNIDDEDFLSGDTDDTTDTDTSGASTDEQEADVVSDPFAGDPSPSDDDDDDPAPTREEDVVSDPFAGTTDDDRDDEPTREEDLARRARETEQRQREERQEREEQAQRIEPGVTDDSSEPSDTESTPTAPPEVTVDAPDPTGEITVDIGDMEPGKDTTQAVLEAVGPELGVGEHPFVLTTRDGQAVIESEQFDVSFQGGEAVVRGDVISEVQQERFQELGAEQAAEFFGVSPEEVEPAAGGNGFTFTPTEGAVGEAREAVENRQQFGVIDPGESDLVRRFSEIDAQLRQTDPVPEVEEADLARRFDATQQAQRERDTTALDAIGARTDEREPTVVEDVFLGDPTVQREEDVVSGEELFTDEPVGPSGIFGDPLRREEPRDPEARAAEAGAFLATVSEQGLGATVEEPLRGFFGVDEAEVRAEVEARTDEDIIDELFGSGGFFTQEEETELLEQAQERREQFDFGADLRRAGEDLGLPEDTLSFLGGTPRDIPEENVVLDPFTGESGVPQGRGLEGFGGVGGLPGEFAALPETALLAGEAGVEAGENIPTATEEFGLGEIGTAIGAEAALGTEELTEQAERDPEAFGGEIVGELLLTAGASRAVTTGADIARSRRVAMRGETTVDLEDISPSETLDEATGIQRFETDPGEPTSAAVRETRRRAGEQPDELQEIFGEDLLFRSESEALSGPLEVGRGEFELPGLFTSPDLSRLRLTEGGESAGLLGDFRLGLPRVRGRGEQVTAFEGDRIEGMPDWATGSGFAVETPEGELIRPVGPAEGRRLAEDIGGTRRPDPETTGAAFLQEEAERGTAFVRPPGSRSRELEAIFPPDTEFVEAGEFAVRGEGRTIPGRAFRRAEEQPEAPSPEDIIMGRDIPETRISRSTRGIDSDPTRLLPPFTPGFGVSGGVSRTSGMDSEVGIGTDPSIPGFVDEPTGFGSPTDTGVSSGPFSGFDTSPLFPGPPDRTTGPGGPTEPGPTGPGPSDIPGGPSTSTPGTPPPTSTPITPGVGDPSTGIPGIPTGGGGGEPSNPFLFPDQQLEPPEEPPAEQPLPFGEEFVNPVLTAGEAVQNPFGGFIGEETTSNDQTGFDRWF